MLRQAAHLRIRVAILSRMFYTQSNDIVQCMEDNMKKEAWKKYMIGGVVAVAFVATMTACNSEKEPSSSPTKTPAASNQASPEATQSEDGLQLDDVVLSVGKTEVTYRELLIYQLQIKNKYEPSLGEDVWNIAIEDGKTFSDMAKDELLSEVTKIKVVVQEAAKLDIALEDSEKEEVETQVVEYMEKITKEDQKKYGITQDMVRHVLEDNYLADKVYTVTTNEVNTDISDEEAKQIKLEMLMVMTNGKDKNGTQIALDETQKKTAKGRAESMRQQALTTEDFASFASANTDASYVDFTFGKGDNPELETTAFSLKVGEISPVIETTEGYVILKLISDFDEDATAQKKEQIIEKQRDDIFVAKYKVWSSEYKITQDAKLWSMISFTDL